jgi:SAM-dependent methyltransferase
MGSESGKARERREREGYFQRYLVGDGIDIGCGNDPVTDDCMRWDLPQGDAQELSGVSSAQFDWVYSSHCLEHLHDPHRAVTRWWEVLRDSGYLLIVVPDEDLYEQGVWPSQFNPDHKSTFTIHKSHSWSPVSINLTELVAPLPDHQTIWVHTRDDGYDHSPGIWDRTGGLAEAHIEVLLRKGEGKVDRDA